jgi:phospholipid N-methyltransferase
LNTLVYLKNLLADKYVASVTPSSRFAINQICGKIDFQASRIIIEYGPGAGAFTLPLLERMRSDSRLIAIERNRNFFDILGRDISDARLETHCDTAGNVLDILGDSGSIQADYIISGIPFSMIPERNEILLNTFRALKPGGRFIAYQTFFQPESCLRRPLRKLFTFVNCEYSYLCVPPLLIIEAGKAKNSTG